MSIFSQVLSVTVPVFGVAAMGYVFGRLSGRDMEAVNKINLNLFCPALLFYVLSEKIPSGGQWQATAWGALIIVLGSALLAWPFARFSRMNVRAWAPSMMFNNSGNLGLPLAALAFGDAALPLAVVTFVVSTSLHFSLGIWLVSGRLVPSLLLRNPIFLATVAGMLAYAFDWHAPAIIMPGLEMLADVAIPLMLVALGVRLLDTDFSHWRAGLLGALLCPLSGVGAALLAIWWLQPGETVSKVLLLFSLMPPAVMNFIIAEQFRQSPDQVASMVAIGNLASLIIIPIGLAFIL